MDFNLCNNIFRSIREIVRPANIRKAGLTRYYYVIIASRTMDYLNVASPVKATYYAHMAVVRIKYQIARLRFRPAYGPTIAVLTGCAAASAHYEAAIAGIIEYPVHKPAAIQPKGAHCTGANAACRPYLLRHLFKVEETLALRLAVLHNLYFYNELTAKIREALDEGRFAAFRSEYSEKLAERV